MVQLLILNLDGVADFSGIGTTPTGFNNSTKKAQTANVTVSISDSRDLTGDAAFFQGAGALADFFLVDLFNSVGFSVADGIAWTGTGTLTYTGVAAAVPLPGLQICAHGAAAAPDCAKTPPQQRSLGVQP